MSLLRRERANIGRARIRSACVRALSIQRASRPTLGARTKFALELRRPILLTVSNITQSPARRIRSRKTATRALEIHTPNRVFHSHIHQSELMIGAPATPVTLHFSIHLRAAGKSCQLDSEISKWSTTPARVSYTLVLMSAATRDDVLHWARWDSQENDRRNTDYITSTLALWNSHPECKTLAELECFKPKT